MELAGLQLRIGLAERRASEAEQGVRRPAFRYSVLGSAEPTFGLKLLVLVCCYARVSGAFHKQIRSDSTTR